MSIFCQIPLIPHPLVTNNKWRSYISSYFSSFNIIGQDSEYDYYGDDNEIWGYCPDTCDGEQPTPSSPYNLASSRHSDVWRSYFYDLSSWENGLCHTYDPPVQSPPDLLSRLYFMMANISAEYLEYDVFLHERGQLWPRSGEL